MYTYIIYNITYIHKMTSRPKVNPQSSKQCGFCVKIIDQWMKLSQNRSTSI